MSNKELIKNILNDISMKVYVGKNITTNYSSGGMNRVLVLFNGTDVSLNAILKGLRELKSQGCLFKLVFSKAAEAILNVDHIINELEPFKVYRESEGYNVHEIVKDTDLAIAANITQNTLAKLAVGVQDSMVSNVLWMLLLEQAKVVMNTMSVFEGAQLLDKNPAMHSVFVGHVEKVKTFGVEVVDDHTYKGLLSIEPVAKSEMKTTVNAVAIKEATTTKKLINEQAILELQPGVTELIINKGQIVTAAAKDLAGSRRIKLRME